MEIRGGLSAIINNLHLLLQILVDGRPLPKSKRKYYFVLNKPKGYLCSTKAFKEQQNPKLVLDLFKVWLEKDWKSSHQHSNAQPPRLFTVGRLDVQSTGLIFITNDGEFVSANSLGYSWEGVLHLPHAGLSYTSLR